MLVAFQPALVRLPSDSGLPLLLGGRVVILQNPTMEIGVAMVFGIGAGFGECQHPELGVQLRLNVLLFQLLHAFQELLKVHPYDDDYTFFVVVGQVGRWNPPSRSCVTWVAVSLQLCGGTPRGTSSRSRPTTRTTLEALNGDDCSDELAHSPRGVLCE